MKRLMTLIHKDSSKGRMVKISIVTTVLNAAASIRYCLESVINQTYDKIEYIVIDGGSVDGTLDIIEEYRNKIDIISTENDSGLYEGMNKGLRRACGEIIGILNADDVFAGLDTLTRVAKVFNNLKIDSCYGDLVYTCSQNFKKVIRYWRSGPFNHRRFYWGWMPPHPTFFVRRKIYKNYGYFNLNMGSAADYELMLRFLVKHRTSSFYIPKILTKMRSGGVSNVSLKNRLRANYYDRLAWKVNGLNPYPWTLFLKPIRKIPQYFIKI